MVLVVGGVGVYQGADHFLVFCVVFGGLLFEEEAVGLFREIVTFAFPSGETSFSGGGRKSATLASLPTGLFGSVEFFFIFLPTVAKPLNKTG